MTDFLLHIYNHRNTLQVITSHVLLSFIITFITVPSYDCCPVSCLSSVLSFSPEYNFLVRERQYLGFGMSGALAGSIAVLSKGSHVSLGHPALRYSCGYTYIALMATKIQYILLVARSGKAGAECVIGKDWDQRWPLLHRRRARLGGSYRRIIRLGWG